MKFDGNEKAYIVAVLKRIYSVACPKEDEEFWGFTAINLRAVVEQEAKWLLHGEREDATESERNGSR